MSSGLSDLPFCGDGVSPLARAVAAAALTTLDQQAVFRLLWSTEPSLPESDLFRLGRGSRAHRPIAAGPRK